MNKIKAAIIGSGNIGTDLMIKMVERPRNLELVAFVGIDEASEGLAIARERGIETTHDGIEGLMRMASYADIGIVFDATSAYAHKKHDEILRRDGKRLIDLTPAALGPFTVPPVNAGAHLDSPNVNMVTCGGQATIPIVAAVARWRGCDMRRSSPRSPRVPPDRARGPISTSSRAPRRAGSRRSAAPSAARRLSS